LKQLSNPSGKKEQRLSAEVRKEKQKQRKRD
jgi:hypothetical protein